MSYDSKFGVTQIRGERRYNLSISRDSDITEDGTQIAQAMFLLTPDMEAKDAHGCPEHDHIELSMRQAVLLQVWLTKFINDSDPIGRDRKKNDGN